VPGSGRARHCSTTAASAVSHETTSRASRRQGSTQQPPHARRPRTRHRWNRCHSCPRLRPDASDSAAPQPRQGGLCGSHCGAGRSWTILALAGLASPRSARAWRSPRHRRRGGDCGDPICERQCFLHLAHPLLFEDHDHTRTTVGDGPLNVGLDLSFRHPIDRAGTRTQACPDSGRSPQAGGREDQPTKAPPTAPTTAPMPGSFVVSLT
jgi:hypothetical protein